MLPHLQQGMGWHQQIPIFFSLEQEQLPPISTATSPLLSSGRPAEVACGREPRGTEKQPMAYKLFSHYNIRAERLQQSPHSPQSLRHLLTNPSDKKFTNPCSRKEGGIHHPQRERRKWAKTKNRSSTKMHPEIRFLTGHQL